MSATDVNNVFRRKVQRKLVELNTFTECPSYSITTTSKWMKCKKARRLYQCAVAAVPVLGKNNSKHVSTYNDWLYVISIIIIIIFISSNCVNSQKTVQ